MITTNIVCPDNATLRALVEGERVHRDLYTDPVIFELEMERIWHRTWIYVGHESQVREPGDYFSTELGREPVIMVRHTDGEIRVLSNRCAHKGAKVTLKRTGNTNAFLCPYHGWTYRTDGCLKAVPLANGYDKIELDRTEFGLRKLPRVDSYRGFVFASLSADVPPLRTFLGPAAEAFDDMADRSPVGEVEVVGSACRVINRVNWKFFLENQVDLVHAGVVHQSSVHGARAAAKAYYEDRGKPVPMLLINIQQQTPPSAKEHWEGLRQEIYPFGHHTVGGYIQNRPTDAGMQAYEQQMIDRYGKEETNRILARNTHQTLIYPCVSVGSTFAQLRVTKPLDVGRTLMETWHLRPKGVPQSFFEERILAVSNNLNTPASIISADDLAAWDACQAGLKSQANDWISQHRDAGMETTDGEVTRANRGTSEMYQRFTYKVWLDYMIGNEAHRER